MRSLPIFVRIRDRPVILLGDGAAAAAKRRLLERAGAKIVDETAEAAIAIVALEDADAVAAAVARLRARAILVNAVDRPELCDFTIPAILDRDPVVVAIGSDGRSAGLVKALRQRFEAMLPTSLGMLAERLHAARGRLRVRYPDGADRRRAIDEALAPGGPLDPFAAPASGEAWIEASAAPRDPQVEWIALSSTDPDELTLRAARLLGQADRILHDPAVPAAILDRARADAERIVGGAPPAPPAAGLTLIIGFAP